MKTILTFCAILWAFSVYGQTADDYLQGGIAKHASRDYKGAIKEYSKAIKLDKENRDAYFNRGVCGLALSDLKSAMLDFNKTLALDTTFVKAYYSRAAVFITENKYLEALPDLNKVIELEPSFGEALVLRGQIRVQIQDKVGACEDFHRAKEFADPKANAFINKFCNDELSQEEGFLLDWPEDEKWEVATNQKNDDMAQIELVRAHETLEKWTEFGSMLRINVVPNISMDKLMDMMLQEAKQHSSTVKLTFLEKDETATNPWIMFTLESPSYKKDKTPESQLWFIVKGKKGLYINFRALRQATIPEEIKAKWIQFFKDGEVITQ